jgi:N-acetylmuramoyl-L-alanine amidase
MIRRVVAVCVALAAAAGACSSGTGSESPHERTGPRTPESSPARSPEPSTTAGDGAAPAGALRGRRICIDPGHDAYWGVGAAGRDAGGEVPVHPTEGIPLVEHELTLRTAYRLASLLEQHGADVCVTRNQAGALQIEPYDFSGDGQVRPDGVALEDGPERTQPRIDWANRFGAEVLVSIHFNSLDDPSTRGTEVYYSDTGNRAEDGRRLAEHLLGGVLAEMQAAGYSAVGRGVLSDRYQRYPPDIQARFRANNAVTIARNGFDPADCLECQRIGVLGNNPMSLHPGDYVGALVEVEFLSNPAAVDEFLLRPDSLAIVAAGLEAGVLNYFRSA